MQHKTGKAHVLGNNRHIQAAEDKSQSFGVLRLNARLGAFQEEAFKTFVFEGADHASSVT